MDSKMTETVQQLARPSITVAFAAIVCLLYLGYRWALPKPIPGVPHDEAAAQSILGSLPTMISYMKQNGVMIPWLTSQNLKHGAPLVQFFGSPFDKPTLILSDFQESQDILLRRTKEFDRASRTLAGFTGLIPDHHISMRSADPRFKGNKELVRDLMSPSFLHEVSATQIYSKSLALIDLWDFKAKAADGGAFEARQDIFDSAMDMVNAAAFAFGDELTIVQRQLNHYVSTKDLTFTKNPNGSVEFPRLPAVPEIAALHAVSEFLGTQLISPMPILTYHYRVLTDASLRRSLVEKDEVIKNQLKKSLGRLESGDETQHSATDYMIQREYSVAKKEGREPDFYSRRTIDELYGYIVAGHETTASSLSWALKLIADHQPVQEKLRQALRQAFPAALAESRQLNAQEIAKVNIAYLDAVIEECLRVGSPTPLVAREAIVDTTILGYKIPKGTTLLLNSAGPGYHSDPIQIQNSARSETSRAKHWGGVWDSQDMPLFKPERWLKKNDNGDVNYDPQAGPFLSFSLGPRGCFGKRLAYLEMRMILMLFLWNFRFKKLEGELASYDTIEGVAVMPKFCYVGLERL